MKRVDFYHALVVHVLSILVLQSKQCSISSLDIYFASCKYTFIFLCFFSYSLGIVSHEFISDGHDRHQRSGWCNSLFQNLAFLMRLQALTCHNPIFLQPCEEPLTLHLYFLSGYFSVAVLWTSSDLFVFADLHRYSGSREYFCWTFFSQDRIPWFSAAHLLFSFLLPPRHVPFYCAYCQLLHSAPYYGIYILVYIYTHTPHVCIYIK